MLYHLIADAGGSKTRWVLLGEDGKIFLDRFGAGINACVTPFERIRDAFGRIVEDVASCLPQSAVEEPCLSIHFYGAGCASAEICHNVAEMLREMPRAADVEVQSDLLGAARSLLGNKPGIACILGTGSNSGFYDGKKIVRNIPSLGYILGDEGGGASLGRLLLNAVFKGLLPAEVISEFDMQYSLSLPTLIERTYRGDAPNTFLASFVPFISSHLHLHEMQEMVKNEFRRFVSNNVLRYEDARSYPISFVGGIAGAFQEMLTQALEMENLQPDIIASDPMAGLIKYHANQQNEN